MHKELFDSGFYGKVYSWLIPEEKSPWEHYVEYGKSRDLLCSEYYDSVLVDMLKDCCKDSDCFSSYVADDSMSTVNFLIELFPVLGDSAYVNKNNKNMRVSFFWKKIVEKISILLGFGRYCGTSFIVKYKNIKMSSRMAFPIVVRFGADHEIKFEGSSAVLRAIDIDEPVSMPRLPHGFWDWFVEFKRVAELVSYSMSISEPDSFKIAERIMLNLYPSREVFAPLFMIEMLEGNLAENEGRMRVSVAFKGYPEYDNLPMKKYVESSKTVIDRCGALDLFFPKRKIFYDAMFWKRLLISGELRDFPKLCSSHPVVLLASDYFNDLGQRWNIDCYCHVKIAPRMSHYNRYSILDDLKKNIDSVRPKSNKKPIVIMQCGGSLGYWLMMKLNDWDDNVFYLDFGQALSGWFLDHPSLVEAQWLCIYARKIIENNCLEGYYRDLLSDNYDRWLKQLS